MTIPIINPLVVTPGRFAARLSAGVFNNPVAGMRLPDRDQLVGEYLLGVDAASSMKNRANPAVPLTQQGAPTFNANSVTVRPHATAGYGFYTGIVPDQNFTWIVVRRNAAIATTIVVAGMDRTGGLGGNYGMRQFGADNYASVGEGATNLGAKRTRPASATEVYFEAAVQNLENPQRSTGGLGSMYWYTAAGVQQSALSDTIITTGSGRNTWKQMCIGSNLLTDSVTTNTVEVFFVALYNKPLSSSQIGAAHSAIVAYYATRNVTVV